MSESKVKRYTRDSGGMSESQDGNWIKGESFDALYALAKEMGQSLQAFIRDPRFAVAVGGNPNAVQAMMKRVTATLEEWEAYDAN